MVPPGGSPGEADGWVQQGSVFADRPAPDTAEAAEAAVGAGTADEGEPVGRDESARPPDRDRAARKVAQADQRLAEKPGPVLSGWWAVPAGSLGVLGCLWVVCCLGVLPERFVRRAGLWQFSEAVWPRLWQAGALGCCTLLTLLAFAGLTRGRVGSAWVLTLFGRYRGSVRRTGLLWVSPLVLRRRVDVRLRHWRSEPMAVVDARGMPLSVVVLVVWRVRDSARALLTVDDHLEFLREQVEAATVRVLARLPADAFHEETPTLRDVEALGAELTRVLAERCAPVGLALYDAQPTRIEYAPAVAAAMRREQLAAIDAKHRDQALDSVVRTADETVRRLTASGLVHLDDRERQRLIKDLTLALVTARGTAAKTN